MPEASAAKLNASAKPHGSIKLAVTIAPLTPPERADLDRLEDVIARGGEVFREVALALLEIRSRRLYRETHRTFDAYCRQKFGYYRRHGDRVVHAAEVIQYCEVNGLPPPANERQARRIRKEAQATALVNGPGPLVDETSLERLRQAQATAERPSDGKSGEIRTLLAELRQLHASHPWRAKADQLLDLYRDTVLPWPTAKAKQ